ncbi:MAG: STAS-like domain-containing protein [Methylococcales bacterium]
MFDDFRIVSGNVSFSPAQGKVEGWILENQPATPGTTVFMKLKDNTSRTTKQVFDSFTTGGNDGFTKTVVSVRLAQVGDEKLISRSQAKSLVVCFDRFKVVILDFEGIETIGQAFADEIFRVFRKQHPDVELQPVNAGHELDRMISRAHSGES